MHYYIGRAKAGRQLIKDIAPCQNHDFLSKVQWTYGPTLSQLLDTHIRSISNRVGYY